MRKKIVIGALIAVPAIVAFACGPRPTQTGTGGRGGTGGSAGTAGKGGAPPTVDITGTWYSRVVTGGKFAVPNVPETDADIETVFKLYIARDGANFNTTMQFCRLATVTKPDPYALQTTYTPAVMNTFKASASAPAFDARIGGPVTIPNLTIKTGANKECTGRNPVDEPKPTDVVCVESDFVDADSDGNPGITLPSTLGGCLKVNGYGNLVIAFKFLSGTLQSADTIVGDSSFTTFGQILRTSVAALQGGKVTVTPLTPSARFTAKHLPGDVPCSEILTKVEPGISPPPFDGGCN
jgi:hypothetical protein